MKQIKFRSVMVTAALLLTSSVTALSSYSDSGNKLDGEQGSFSDTQDIIKTVFSIVTDAPTKFRLFLMCRSECSSKCDRVVYLFAPKKTFCHQCITECLQVVQQQASALGIALSDSPVCRTVLQPSNKKTEYMSQTNDFTNNKQWLSQGMQATQPLNSKRKERRGGKRGRGRNGNGRGRKNNKNMDNSNNMKMSKNSNDESNFGQLKNCIYV